LLILLLLFFFLLFSSIFLSRNVIFTSIICSAIFEKTFYPTD
jgi:hypothetical protein